MLGISPKQLNRLIHDGALQVIALGASTKGDRIEASAINDLINAKRTIRRSTCPSISVRPANTGGTSSGSMESQLTKALAKRRAEKLKK